LTFGYLSGRIIKEIRLVFLKFEEGEIMRIKGRPKGKSHQVLVLKRLNKKKRLRLSLKKFKE